MEQDVDHMEESYLTKIIAPCGLNCCKCLAFEGGEIQTHSRALAELLGSNFQVYAERFSQMNPVFKNYPAFKALLELLCRGTCGGCRKEGCLFQACGVHTCVKEKDVDFCFECKDFPCENTGLPAALHERWKGNNRQMKDLGIAGFYEKIKGLPRYP